MDKSRRWLRAARFAAVEGGAGAVSLMLVILGLICVPLLLLAGGWAAVPRLVRGLQGWADRGRRRVARFSGVDIDSRYAAIPPDPTLRELQHLLWAPSTRREVVWLAAHAIVGSFVGLFTVVLPLATINSLLVPAYWWALPADEPVGSPFPVTSWARAAAMPLVAVGFGLLAWWLIPLGARWLAEFLRNLLAPTRASRLAERLTAVSASRAAALDAHAAELRRIERDLHDGAQNRLVAVVMMLGIAERSLTNDPESALPQLRRAQDAANDALSGLRTIVHDIYPPILDDLGLEGALSALAGRSAIPCELRLGAVGRVPAAVESAAYFVVAESLTNSAKHSGAKQISISVERAAEQLTLEVVDDGGGDAMERPGGGLAGMRRRVQAFEGEMKVVSPPGGPTRIEVALPCGL
ncbi:sensor histidine kinase [Rhodococcus sp. 1168]|uniref:sensor histidine kinase n=1 Tax=Rhodococcus sp. 1168 TaxID=2018041 RepID=UPI000A0D8818|nr:sensor histidine kinase [Rhodococcus sp. 1168]ORI15528.1 sensor histidine kinase [Rhodococcus sp. 1168]